MYCKAHFCKITVSNCPPNMMLIRKYCLPYQKWLSGSVKEDHAQKFNFLPARIEIPKAFEDNFTWVKVLGKGKDQNTETTEVKIANLQSNWKSI